MRGVLLTLFLNVTSRLLLRRDRLNGTMKQVLSAFPFANERLVIPSASDDCRLSMFRQVTTVRRSRSAMELANWLNTGEECRIC